MINAEARKPRGKVMTMALTLALAMTLLLPATPAHAGTTPCSVYPWDTWLEGSTMYGGATIDCSGTGRWTDYIRSKLQERSYGIVFTRDDDPNSVQTTGALSVRTEYNCGGHGTDEWRSTAYGEDANGDWDYEDGPWEQNTC